MARKWYLGANRYVFTQVYTESGEDLTINSSTYSIYDTSDESIVASGLATVQDQIIFCLWEPSEIGIYVVDFDYVIGDETFTSRQVVEVTETL